MKFTELFSLITAEHVIFRIIDSQSDNCYEMFNNSDSSLRTALELYKDLDINSVIIKKSDINHYEVTIDIDIYDDTVYILNYHSMSDNCQKTVHLTYDQIYNLRRVYEECDFSKDFRTYLNLVFSFNK